MYTIIKASDIDTSQNAWELMEFSNSVEDILECFILYEYPNTSTLFLSLGSKQIFCCYNSINGFTEIGNICEINVQRYPYRTIRGL